MLCGRPGCNDHRHRPPGGVRGAQLTASIAVGDAADLPPVSRSRSTSWDDCWQSTVGCDASFATARSRSGPDRRRERSRASDIGNVQVGAKGIAEVQVKRRRRSASRRSRLQPDPAHQTAAWAEFIKTAQTGGDCSSRPRFFDQQNRRPARPKPQRQAAASWTTTDNIDLVLGCRHAATIAKEAAAGYGFGGDGCALRSERLAPHAASQASASLFVSEKLHRGLPTAQHLAAVRTRVSVVRSMKLPPTAAMHSRSAFSLPKCAGCRRTSPSADPPWRKSSSKSR